MGYSFSLSPSGGLALSFPFDDSVRRQFCVLVTVTCRVSDCPLLFLRSDSSSSLSTLLHTAVERRLCVFVCVCGPSSDLLWAGLDQLSCQAAAGDPPRLFVTVQVWQAEALPAHDGPIRVHALQLLLSYTHIHRESLVYTSY